LDGSVRIIFVAHKINDHASPSINNHSLGQHRKRLDCIKIMASKPKLILHKAPKNFGKLPGLDDPKHPKNRYPAVWSTVKRDFASHPLVMKKILRTLNFMNDKILGVMQEIMLLHVKFSTHVDLVSADTTEGRDFCCALLSYKCFEWDKMIRQLLHYYLDSLHLISFKDGKRCITNEMGARQDDIHLDLHDISNDD
jgi:hypothetical protein